MDKSTAQHLINLVAALDLAATSLVVPVAELNRDRVLSGDSLGTLGAIQLHIAALRRQIHTAGALTVLRAA
jgi:hypothetical protein